MAAVASCASSITNTMQNLPEENSKRRPYSLPLLIYLALCNKLVSLSNAKMPYAHQ